MHKFRPGFAVAAALTLCLAAGCQSADTIAANQAAKAQADLQQGRLTAARLAIGKAIAARDDVLDYWLLKAQIDLQGGDRGSAFNDYEIAIQLDHTNLEALQALCQLGLTAAQPDSVDKYADQLLMLSPGAPAALTAKGSIALARHDPDAADGFADRVLSQNPQDLPALSLKARILISRSRFAEAAAMIEKTVDTPANTPAKLKLLKDVYAQAHDRAAYDQTVRRLAEAIPDDADIQLNYADVLYQDGQNEQARGVIRKMMVAYPDKLQVAAAALGVWLAAGPQALDSSRMIADAAPLSIVMKADYAQFANETGHPEIAIAILQGAGQGDPTPENSNAKAALAYALGVTGHRAEAMAQLNAILDDRHDPDQPWALLARARLLAAAHDYEHAIRDARLLVANDRNNATAHLALADILQASGSADLSESALREGLRANPASTRLAARLAATLAARGDKDQAGQVALDLYRTAEMDLRAKALLQTYDPAAASRDQGSGIRKKILIPDP
jgi:Tfp pilus assembly protein PilF